jgi:hypothetical protein
MNIVIENAKRFVDEVFRGSIPVHGTFEEEFESNIGWLRTDKDKIDYINYIIKELNTIFEIHQKGCRDEQCNKPYHYQMITYFLQHELADFGIVFNEDSFTTEDKLKADDILQKIIDDLNEIKAGQEVIFNEINELKDLYFLGKKKWYQLLAGKSFDMVASGIVSETVCKKIIQEFSVPMAKLIHDA